MVLGETEVVFECTGADWEHGGRRTGLAHPALVGLADRMQRSPCRKRYRVTTNIRMPSVTYHRNPFFNLLTQKKNFERKQRSD